MNTRKQLMNRFLFHANYLGDFEEIEAANWTGEKVDGTDYLRNRPDLLPLDRSLKSIGGSLHEKANSERLDCLSYFVEQSAHVPEVKVDEIAKSRSNDPVAEENHNSFTRRGDKVVFEFRHFVDPAKVVSEYIAANAYSKSRLAKVDKKKLSKIRQRSPEVVPEANEESRDDDSNEFSVLPDVKSLGRLKKTNAKTFIEKHRKMQKLRERVSATKNIVVEFCPEGDNVRGLADTGNGTKFSAIHSATGKSFGRRRRKSTELPKLHSIASAPNCNTKTLNVDFSNASLPGLKKHERLERRSGEREVAAIKSNWQILKEKRNWTRGKDRTSGQRTRLLYETLGDVNKKIDKMERLYLAKSEKEFLHQGVAEVVRDPASLIFEDEATKMKEKLFPKDDPGRSLEELHRRLRKERIMGDGLKNSTLSLLKRSWLDGNRIGAKTLESIEVSEADRANDLSRARVDPAIRLDEDDEEDLKKEEINNFEFKIPSTRKVEELFARMKIRNCEFYEDIEEETRKDSETRGDFEKCQEFKNTGTEIEDRDLSHDDLEKKCRDIRVGNWRDAGSKIEDDSIYEWANGELRETGIEKKNDTPYDRENGKSSGNERLMDGETFLKMALDGSRGRVPEHFRSQILKSNYLQRDLRPL